eukprot:9467133-Pyramimonas_sp.AAC.1
MARISLFTCPAGRLFFVTCAWVRSSSRMLVGRASGRSAFQLLAASFNPCAPSRFSALTPSLEMAWEKQRGRMQCLG